MSSVYLGEYVDNATYHLEHAVPRLAEDKTSWREMQELCTWYRQRAVCSLLLTGVARDFYVNMMQSAAAFIHFLSRCPEDQKVTSQAKPFFDALCAGHIHAARQIGALSRTTWHQGMEYEEDFLYIATLMALIADPPGASSAELIERLEVAAQGTEPFRVEVCRALIQREAEAFEAALEDNLASRVEGIEGLVASGSLPDEFAAWLRHFSSEGFALVRIAEAIGLPAAGPYLHVPQITRAKSPLRFDPTAWQQIHYRP